VTELADLLAVLDLDQVEPGRFRAGSLAEGQVVFGGQLLAQAIVAATTTVADKELESLHTVFCRGAGVDAPLEIDVDVAHAGRSFATADVTVRQGERLCVRSVAFLHQPDDDLIRHQLDAPSVAPAEQAEPRSGNDWWEVRFADDADIADPDAVGPAALDVWTRMPEAPSGGAINQALLAYATDGFLIGTAMRPHAGVGQDLAHVSIATTVLTHTITFHEPVDLSAWVLLSQTSPHAGRGRSYGRGDVFDTDGRLVASFVQQNMIRDFPEHQRPAPTTNEEPTP
jgi:acyl-CoA thioesterase